MRTLFFGAANPQPVGHTGAHLEHLDKMYLEGTSLPLETVLARIMIVGATVRMIADSIRFASHAMRDCWQQRTVTVCAFQSLGDAIRHLVLAIFTIAFGLLFPRLIIKVAYRIGILPHHCLIETVASTVTSVACLALALGAGFLVTRAALSLPPILACHQQRLVNLYGETNVKAASVAVGAIACSSAGYKFGWYAYNWGSLNGLWVCYRFVSFICLPRHFSL